MAGEILKKRREESGQNLKEISHALRIRSDYLKAIEDDSFEKLPVEVYAKGYIREYAKYLKTDPEIILEAYSQKIAPAAPEKSIPASVFLYKKKSKTRYLLPTALLLSIAAAYITYSITDSHEELEAPQPVSQTQPVQKMDVKPEEIKAEKTEEIKIGNKEAPPKEYILEILATDTTWLLVNIDGAEARDMLLKQGDTKKLAARQGFMLKVGNAGGIKLRFDGKEIGTPGGKGQVITLNLPSDQITSQ